jgi:hypothetical protein
MPLASSKIAFYPEHGPWTDRDDTVLAAFSSANQQKVPLPVQITHSQIHQFRPSDSTGIEQFHDGTIATPLDLGYAGLREHALHLGWRKNLSGQLLLNPGHGHGGGKIHRQHLLPK